MKLPKMTYQIAQYQGIRNFECPECGEDFLNDENHNYVIGYDETINGNYVIICECPNCFTKSYCHSDKKHIESIEMLKTQLGEIKENTK